MDGATLDRLTAWRRDLHRQPELSGQEEKTALAFARAVAVLSPDLVLTGLGGHGVAVVFEGAAPGPTVMIRAELDALPITETSGVAWSSERAGLGHLCGHDGHLTILLGLAEQLSASRPARGCVVLLAQPAEENGSGAAAVLADPDFAQVRPDWAFALHNLPGVPLGTCWLKPGAMNCASVGLKIALHGRTAHASEPDKGLSPGPAVARLIPALGALGPGGDLAPDFRLVTVTHANLGAPAFGIAPGEAEVWATLRTLSDAPMATLRADAEALVSREAGELGVTLTWHDDFAACANDADATAQLAAAIRAERLALSEGSLPMRASEDFGRFASVSKTAMFCLGAGEDHPPLHAPDYDFPDALIDPGVRIFARVVSDLLG